MRTYYGNTNIIGLRYNPHLSEAEARQMMIDLVSCTRALPDASWLTVDWTKVRIIFAILPTPPRTYPVAILLPVSITEVYDISLFEETWDDKIEEVVDMYTITRPCSRGYCDLQVVGYGPKTNTLVVWKVER